MYCSGYVKKVLYNYLANREEYSRLHEEYEDMLRYGDVKVQKYTRSDITEGHSDSVADYVSRKGEIESRLRVLWREVHAVERLRERLIWCYEGERYFCSEALKVLECEYIYRRECRGMNESRKKELQEWIEQKVKEILNRHLLYDAGVI